MIETAARRFPGTLNYKRLLHGNPEHAEYIAVNWCLGNTCNFSCSYCPEGLHDGSNPWPELANAIKFVDRVFKHYGPHKKYFFEFTGGEVSTYKDLPLLFAHIKERGGKVGLISNGSRSLDYWKRLAPLIDQICLSFHAEFAKKDHYLEVVKLLSPTVRTHINIMMSLDHFDLCCELTQEIVKIPNLSLALQPLLKNLESEVYPYNPSQQKIIDSQFELFGKSIQYTKSFEYFRGAMICEDFDGRTQRVSPQKFISTKSNQWQGWDCSAGLEQFVVDMAGDVWRGWCYVGGLVGHIADDDLKFPVQTVRCTKSECHCNFDIMCTKVNPGR